MLFRGSVLASGDGAVLRGEAFKCARRLGAVVKSEDIRMKIANHEA